MVIWYAIAIYITGVAVILYTRPAFMFRDDGVWKEFGLSSRENFTVFPFWMFALVWSILSYALANLASMFVASVVAKSSPLLAAPTSVLAAPGHSLLAAPSQNVANTYVPLAPPSNNFIPVSSMASQHIAPPSSFPASALNEAANAAAAAPPRLPGYYVLEGAMNGPRYVYWGPEPPRF